MKKTTTFKTALRQTLLALAICMGCLLPSQAQVFFTIDTHQAGDELTADFYVSNFTAVLSMQFTIQWDVSKMTFVGTSDYALPSMGAASFGTTPALVDNGFLTLSWLDPPLNAVTVPFCTHIFSVKFLVTGAEPSALSIGNSPTPIEITVLPDTEPIGLVLSPDCVEAGELNGHVFHDLNLNCQKEGGEPGLNGRKVKIEGNNGGTYYRTTNSEGNYTLLLLPGLYDVSLLSPDVNVWGACQSQVSVEVLPNQEVTADFAAQALVNCPLLTVDLGTAFLRRCFPSTYFVQYCNQGTLPAEDAYVELSLDPFLSYESSSIPFSSASNGVYTFPVGDLEVNECGSFAVTVMVSCDAVLGQTHCSRASIFPYDPCIAPNPLWDGSSLNVQATCDGDSVRFQIQNMGEDMEAPVEFIVIEDDMINFAPQSLQLPSGGMTEVTRPANGSTWRVEVEQTPMNPALATEVSASVEGCGLNGSGTFSLGFINQFPLNDEDYYVDADCQQNIGAFDPNDKQGYPIGYCGAHLIERTQGIEYHIRFQNTGTDTAFTVVVRDTLSPYLNPATVQPGAASHPYEFEMLGEGVVQFTFHEILLPDSTDNEPASHGFVKFNVGQKPDNQLDVTIRNQAGIVFDFNEPVITNEVFHTTGENFLINGSGGQGTLSVSGYVRTWWGQPLDSAIVYLTDNCLTYTDQNGFYKFENVVAGEAYTMVASKVNHQPRKDVTILDMAKMKSLVLALAQPLSLFQNWSGDFNLSNSVTTFDIVQLSKFITCEFPLTTTDWRFVNGDYVFPAQVPSNANFSYTFDNLSESLDSINFTAYQRGNALPEALAETVNNPTHFYFEMGTMTDSTLEVAVKATDFNSVEGFQFGLNWDPTEMGFLFLQPGAIGGPALVNHFLTSADNLNLTFLHSQPGSLSFLDSTTLFTLVFKPLGLTMGSVASLDGNGDCTPLQVVLAGCKLAGNAKVIPSEVMLGTAVHQIESEGLVLSIAPNPSFTWQERSLEVRSERAQALQLELFSANGDFIWQGKRPVSTGKSSLALPQELKKGVYFLKVSAENGNGLALKLVVI